MISKDKTNKLLHLMQINYVNKKRTFLESRFLGKMQV